jgi:putative acetyltransferase
MPEDIPSIRELTQHAFRGKAFSRQTEHLVLDALRSADALCLSLVAVVEGTVAGHVAFSRVTLSQGVGPWYALGPVSVQPTLQRRGIGTALIWEGLARITRAGASGCALAGNPAYYGRFGFQRDDLMVLEGIPAEASLVLRFSPNHDRGIVRFHEAFQSAYPVLPTR